MNKVTYIPLPMKNRFFSPCAQILLDGKFWGYVYPHAVCDVDRRTSAISITFTTPEYKSLTCDIMPGQLEPMVSALTSWFPPF